MHSISCPQQNKLLSIISTSNLVLGPLYHLTHNGGHNLILSVQGVGTDLSFCRKSCYYFLSNWKILKKDKSISCIDLNKREKRTLIVVLLNHFIFSAFTILVRETLFKKESLLFLLWLSLVITKRQVLKNYCVSLNFQYF